jgi:hypothetical protein
MADRPEKTRTKRAEPLKPEFVSRAGAKERSASDLSGRLVERRAFEAVVWGMPAVNTDLMLQEMLTKAKGKVNQVLYWSRPADSKNQTLTPNPDSIYFMVFFDTKEVGPVVIDIPPADDGSFAGNIVNVWQMPLEDAGPEGADEGKGGKYLLLPPGYKRSPPSGYIVLPSDTYTGFALLRSSLESHSDADVASAVAYGKRVQVYPLSRAAVPPATTFTDATGVLFDSTIPYDLRFFESLDRVVQYEPWLDRDRLMIDQLRSIGIEKGKEFAPDAKTFELLESAVDEAKAWLAVSYDEGPPPFWPGSRWGNPVFPEFGQAVQTGYADVNSYPVDRRGVVYTFAFVGIKRLGTAQFYLMSIRDANDEDLDGARTYKLTVPPNAPVTQYWSATAYDRDMHTLIRDVTRASRASQTSKPNADGSVDIYFGPKAPAGKEDNWVPTKAGARFEVMFRLYGPEKSLFDKKWKLPDIAEMG